MTKPLRLVPRVTGEQLLNVAKQALLADPLSKGEFAHKGSPDRVDSNGHTKRRFYEATANGDEAFFDGIAKQLNSGSSWLSQMVSTRTWSKDNRTGKVRPIDIPPEAKRLYAWWVRHFLQELVDAQGYLEPTVIGFRDISEFPDYRERAGYTIQDVFASKVWLLLKKAGPWAVSLDLVNAYPNLPHKAIHEALKGLEPRKEHRIRHQERRRIVELVRVRTRLPDGRLHSPRGKGIEQGNPISPLIFSMVVSMMARRVRDRCEAPLASFGDDIVLVAPTEVEANQAFEVFQEVADELGFEPGVIRPIGTEGKATRIYDTRVEALPLIKTYLVGNGMIALTEAKAADLIKKLPPNPTVAAIKRQNSWKAASKGFLRTLSPAWQARWGPTYDPRPRDGEGRTQGGRRTLGTHNSGNPPDVDVPTKEDAGEREDGIHVVTRDSGDHSPLSPYRVEAHDDDSPHMVESHGNDTVSGTTVRTGPGLVPPSANPNGRSPAPRGGSEVSVTADQDVEAVGHHTSTSKTVVSSRPKDLDALREGRRLSGVGDHYRGLTIDIRGLGQKVPVWRLPFAIDQLARVGSRLGKTRFLVHPGEPWVHRDDLLGGAQDLAVKRHLVEDHPDGQVFVLRRQQGVGRMRTRPGRDIPPDDVNLVVHPPQHHRHDSRGWTVRAVHWDTLARYRCRAQEANRDIGKAEVIAKVLQQVNPSSVAVPRTGLLAQHLLKETRPRNVILHDSLGVLREWTWETSGKDWMVGRRAGAQH